MTNWGLLKGYSSNKFALVQMDVITYPLNQES